MMEYKGYLAQVEFDDEANLFHGEVVNLQKDVITFQGQSVAELRDALTDSVEDYLEFCVTRGEAPELPFSGRLTLHLPPVQYRQVIAIAKRAGKTVESWAIEVLSRAVF